MYRGINLTPVISKLQCIRIFPIGTVRWLSNQWPNAIIGFKSKSSFIYRT